MAAYRDTTSSIFHWVTQYQLLPVWQEYPPPFTAYESQILEKDREKYYPVFCSAQATPDFETHRISASPEGPITNAYDSKSSELFSSFSFFDSMPAFSLSPHEIPKTPKIRLYPAPYQPNSRPSLPLSAPESQESSDFSQEDNRDEDSEDVENSEEEPEIYGGKRRGYDLSNLNEVVQPRKKTKNDTRTIRSLRKSL